MDEFYVEKIREFNRFYTNYLGVLNNTVLDSPYSLPEARILFELHQRKTCTSKDILADMYINKGYLSRILKKFEKDKLIRRKKSTGDARYVYIFLTSKGKEIYSDIERTVNAGVEKMISSAGDETKKKLVKNMIEIKEILSGMDN